MIKESCNLIRQQTELAKTNQRSYSHMLSFFDVYNQFGWEAHLATASQK